VDGSNFAEASLDKMAGRARLRSEASARQAGSLILVIRPYRMPHICPKCQGSRVVEGKHFNWIAGGSPQYFQPKELRLFCSGSAHLRIKKSGFLACADCGLLWSEVEPSELQSLLSKSGDKKVKARLGL
jgi:hypothetical protein